MSEIVRWFFVLSFIFTQTFNFGFSQKLIEEDQFVHIKSGYFFIGNDKGDEDEKPPVKIFINEFYMSKYEVSNKQYCKFLNELKPCNDSLKKLIDIDGAWLKLNCKIFKINNSYKVEEGFENFPVNYISWYGAKEYCEYYGYRLPTESEWEYTAKGGRNTIFKLILKNYKKYSGSNEAGNIAWFRKNSGNKVHEVGTKEPNRLKVYDMSGNLDEWCADWYRPDYYLSIEKEDPQGPIKADFKVIKGGSWYNSEKMLRSDNRRASNPKSQKATIGFRIVKDIEHSVK